MKVHDLMSKGSIFEIMRFGMVGGLATLTDLVLCYVLISFTALEGMENVVNTIAFLAAFWVSFFGHRYFTFKKKGNPIKFFVLAVTTLILRNIIVAFMVFVLDVRGMTALFTAIVAVTVITYVIAKFRIFN
ncbi:MAG: GtrA family protein, partial [Succinivibrio sp.]